MTDERPTVAGLYLNRIEDGIPLQADPTVIFATGDFLESVVFAQDATINSASGVSSSLTVRAVDLPSLGQAASIFFNADIGAANPLSKLSVLGEGDVAFGGASVVSLCLVAWVAESDNTLVIPTK